MVQSEDFKSVGAALENSKGLPIAYTALGKLVKENPEKFEQLKKDFLAAKDDESRISALKGFAIKHNDLIKFAPGEQTHLESWWVTVTVTTLLLSKSAQ